MGVQSNSSFRLRAVIALTSFGEHTHTRRIEFTNLFVRKALHARTSSCTGNCNSDVADSGSTGIEECIPNTGIEFRDTE